jgi:3-hydroxyisobutyrate dehydrogenase-like beta-hydroxyacid dehydrogenase
MGYLMARNLANHKPTSLPLLIFNRTPAKCAKLVQELGSEAEGKVRIAQSAEQLAIECDVIITSLANDEAVKSVYAEFARVLTQTPPTRNKIFVETSMIYPNLAGELDTLISQFPHSHLITCPVFGAPRAADKSELVIVMSGDYRSKKEVAYLLVPAVGRKAVDLGGNVEKAPTLKLIGNSIILGCVEVLAEAQTLAEKSGIGAEAVHNFVKDILPAGPLIGYSEKMVYDLFDGTKGFAIAGGIKNASLVRSLTSEHSAPMPVIDTAYQHLLTARALHAGQVTRGTQQFDTLDWSAIIAGARVAAGLDGFDNERHAKVQKEN